MGARWKREYTVYLQGNKQVAFFGQGAALSSMRVYKPSGALLGNVPTTPNGVYKYGVLTTSNEAGYYKISISGCCGVYYVNCLTGHGDLGNANTAYNRSEAAKYALRYYSTANSKYHEFEADCTNFVSQCVYAGGMPMIFGSGYDNHWYYTSASDYSPSWSGADFFMRHWTKVRLSSYNGRAYSVRIYTREYILQNRETVGSFISVGDVVHYLQSIDSKASHSQIFAEKVNNTTIKTCSHSDGFYYGDWFEYVKKMDSNRWIVVVKIRNS